MTRTRLGVGLLVALAGLWFCHCDKPKPDPTKGKITDKGMRQFGTAQDDQFVAVTASAGAFVYAAGTTTGQLPGASSLGKLDGVLVKYDESGQVLWQRQLSTAQEDGLRGLAADPSGNVYAVGYTSGAFDGQSNLGGFDAVVARYRSDGSLEWVRQFGTSADDYLLAVAVDDAGSAYVVGWTNGMLPAQTLSGNSDGFVAKYLADGSQAFVKQLGSTQDDLLGAIALDASGNLYVGGWGTGSVLDQNSQGGRDAAIYKLSSSLSLEWARFLGTGGGEAALSLAVDGSSLYIAGTTTGALLGAKMAGAQDGFVARYDLGGAQQWVRQLGSINVDQLTAVAVASGGGVYAGGFAEQSILDSEWLGQKDALLVKYTADGTLDYLYQFGTALEDQILGLSAPAPAQVYAVGFTAGTLRMQTSNGGQDAFLANIGAR